MQKTVVVVARVDLALGLSAVGRPDEATHLRVAEAAVAGDFTRAAALLAEVSYSG
ncbi:hypothetical protein ACFYST_17685 [Kitasatospora sp. NPDC004614]|uniref:hypothetical protein n=1 Tax=unclassified Kitasatospora TaxID=2633591 RepID=UPI0036AE28FB